MVSVLKASTGIGVAKARVAEGPRRVGGIARPAYAADGERHAWRFAGAPRGNGGRAAFRGLR
eukprot:11059537-Alexandrium_andersonii.AAC.1